MKTLSNLLVQRQTLLRQVRLANLAFAYDTLRTFAARVARSRLTGTVKLQQAAPDAERFWAALTAVDFSQAVAEEHFSDEDVMELADLVAFVTGTQELDLTFRIEDLGESFVSPLRQELEREGVAIDAAGEPTDARR